jgi:stage IV sporulation protein B
MIFDGFELRRERAPVGRRLELVQEGGLNIYVSRTAALDLGVCKGVRGKAGELRGMFLNDKAFGKAEKLCECGIFGYISNSLNLNDLPSAVATSESVIPGKAYIYSTVNGVCPKKYEIEIVKVDKHSKDNKNYVIRITDEDLISETGGIVQGMSGSPILQEGKLIGAVTHVFLNDPMRGYGIDIERMLEK